MAHFNSGKTNAERRNEIDAKLSDVIRLYLGGFTTKDIRQELSIGENSFYRLLNMANLDDGKRKRKPTKIITKQEEDEIIAKFQDRWSMVDISERYGITERRVSNILSSHGLEYKRISHPDNMKQIYDEYMSGMTLVQLSEKYQVTTVWILKLLRDVDKDVYIREMKITHPKKTRDDEFFIIQEYLSGNTGSEVGDKFGISNATVYKVLRNNNIPRRESFGKSTKNKKHYQRPDLEDKEDEIVKLYESGLSANKIGKRFNTDNQTIWGILKRYGFVDTKRDIGSQIKNQREKARIDTYKDEVVRLYQSGMSQDKITKKLQIAKSSVKRLLKDAGVRMKRVGPYPLSGSPGWRGGKIDFQEKYGITTGEWDIIRNQIKTRDEFTCQKCGEKHKTLNVHHIIPARYGGGNENSNLITLCINCHKRIEHFWWNYVEAFQMYLMEYHNYNDIQRNWIDYIPRKHIGANYVSAS